VTAVRRTALALLCAAIPSSTAAAQGYRLRLDTRAQGVSFRGVLLDSILANDTVTGPFGGPTTPDGFAVRCAGSDAYCSYFRPGPRRRGGPLTTVADLSLWGLGIEGLSARATARYGLDLGRSDVWPGVDPPVQLLEGYVELARPRWTARAGRLATTSRLGTYAFDGGRLTIRHVGLGLELGGFLGSGLARGAALPVTSPALNPLDDFQPRRRQIAAGVGAGWTAARWDVRADYLREVDPRADYFVSERIGMGAAARLPAGLSVSGGATYDLAAGWWGTAEAALAYVSPGVSYTLGVRRYRPHLELWTIWGAFSPVPYNATHGRLAIRVRPWLHARARGERYEFEPAAAETPLVQEERDGWRWEVGGTVAPHASWSVDLGYHREFGPGASSAGVGGSATYTPGPAVRVTAHAASLDRPLEFRFSDAALRTYGLDAEVRPSPRVRLALGAASYVEERARPDPAAFDWDQVRVTARVALEFGRGADERAVPPAIRRLPGGRSAR
jgi:hypothetical protein